MSWDSITELSPTRYSLLYGREEIREAVGRIGAQVREWALQTWEESHTQVIAIPVLRGGAFFFVDLVRAVGCSVEMLHLQASSYKLGVNQEQNDSVALSLDGVAVAGREVLLIDDICDSGRTLKALVDALLARGARGVRSAVIIKREVDPVTYNPDWYGFSYKGSEWLVGYGMDDVERWRNQEAIYIIRQGS